MVVKFTRILKTASFQIPIKYLNKFYKTKASSLSFEWFAKSLENKSKADDGNKFIFKSILEKKHEVGV